MRSWGARVSGEVDAPGAVHALGGEEREPQVRKIPAHRRAICARPLTLWAEVAEAPSRYAHLLREVMCRAASFKVRELICPSIALAADPDGTFAVARMQPVFRGAVQI